MGFIGLLSAFGLGLAAGGVGGLGLGFVWYERKCRLLSDHSGERAAAIRAELEDVMDRRSERRRPAISPAPDHGFDQTPAPERSEAERGAERFSEWSPWSP